MPLEATMIIIDNSEYMRNGDYQPSRYEAQSDAVTTVFQTKVDSNPENTVGVMTMAGKGPEVLVTHSKDLGQILAATHETASKIFGEPDLPTAISIAQLALKHRQNKNLRQRVVVFVGSPLAGQGTDEKSLVKLAKKLKKNNVALDLVVFGDAIEDPATSTAASSSTEGAEGRSGGGLLKAFIDAVNSGDNSHLVVIPPGPHLLSDHVRRSAVLSEDASAGIPEELQAGGGGGAGAGGAAENFEYGVDPSLDPELAMALRMSMEEHQAREAAANQAQSSDAAGSSAPKAAAASATMPADPTDDEEEAMLQKALALSNEQDDVEMGSGGAGAAHPAPARGAAGAEAEEDDDEDMDEAAAIERAIQMSLEQEGEGKDET